MSDDDGLFREIDEDVRREQMTAIWDKYGLYIMGALAAIILGVIGYKLNNYWTQQGAERGAAHLLKAESLAEEKKVDEAMKLYKKLSTSGPAGYAALSKLRLGSLEAAGGKQAEAIAQFKSVAKDGSIDPIFSEFATIQTAMLTVDKEIPADILTKLKSLSENTVSGWRYNALEILALSSYKAKKYKDATDTYAKIVSDRKSPPGLKKRAEMMIRMIATTLAQDAAAVKEAPKKADAGKKK